MQEAFIGQQFTPAGRFARVFANLAVTAIMGACAWAASASHARGETLRWKLNPGEVLRYTMESKEVVTFNVQGKDKKSIRTTTSTTNLSWTITEVSANGDALVTLRCERVRMRIDQSPFIPMEFDSTPNNREIPDDFEALDRQIKAMAGAELTFKLRPNGEVIDLRIPEKTLKAFREAAPPGSPAPEAGGEKALRDQLMQVSPPPFPSEPVEPGKNWAAKPATMPVPGLGTLKIEKVFTFEGPDPKTPKLLQVGVESKISLEPDESVAAKIRKQEGSGSLTFDAATGRIVNTRNKQKLEIAASQRGQDMVQSTDTTSSMTLEP